MLCTSCNNATAPTPASIEKTVYDQMQKGDYCQAITLHFDNIDNSNDYFDSLGVEKQELIAEFAQKTKESYDAMNGLKSYEIIKEEISEDGKKAIVETRLIFGDSTEEINTTEYVKKDDGAWKIYAPKQHQAINANT